MTVFIVFRGDPESGRVQSVWTREVDAFEHVNTINRAGGEYHSVRGWHVNSPRSGEERNLVCRTL